MGLSLVTLRVDSLSLLFGYIFLIAAFLGGLYALHVRDTASIPLALIYAGSALGAVFAGDLVTLFFFWEGIAVASVFLIWASRTESAYRAGMRYIVIQLECRFRGAYMGDYYCYCKYQQRDRSRPSRSPRIPRA